MDKKLRDRLTEFLIDKYSILVNEWINTLQSTLEQYHQRSFDELQNTVSVHLDSVLTHISDNDTSLLDEFICQIARMRSDMKFRLSGTLKAFTAGKDIIIHHVRKSGKFTLEEIPEIISLLEKSFNYSIYKYSEIFQEFRIREIEKKNRALILMQEREAHLRLLNLIATSNNIETYIYQSLVLIVDIMEAQGGALYCKLDGSRDEEIRKFYELPSQFQEIVDNHHRYSQYTFVAKHFDQLKQPMYQVVAENTHFLETLAAKTCKFNSWIGVPVKTSGQTIGTVELFFKNVIEFKKHYGRLLDLLGQQIALGINEVLLKHKMKQQEYYLTSITSNSADAILFVDLENKIRTWNKGGEIIFGYKTDEVIRKDLSLLIPAIHLENKPNSTRHTWIKEKFFSNYEIQGKKKNGADVYLNLTQTNLEDSNGNIFGTSIIIRDITHNKLIEQKLIHSEKLATIGKMSANLVHEIKNPLSSLVLNVELIKDEIKSLPNSSREEVQTILGAIAEELDILNDVTEEYLQFARMPQLFFSMENLNEIIQNLVTLMEPKFQQSNIEIVAFLDEKIPRISVDRYQVSRSFLNVLKNSCEAVAGGGKVVIKTKHADDNSFIEIIFQDNGVGMDNELKKRIFEPFFTSKDHGTGLGLFYARSVIDKHGGSIKVESEKGKQTTFIITLPVSSKPGEPIKNYEKKRT